MCMCTVNDPIIYNGPSILRLPMGPRKCGLILQVVLNKGHLTQKLPFGTKSSGLIIKGGLQIEVCKIEGLLYIFLIQSVHTKNNTTHCEKTVKIFVDWLYYFFQGNLVCNNFIY